MGKRIYGRHYYQPPSLESPPHLQHFGHFVVSLTHADLRIRPDGIEVFTDDERLFHPLAAPTIPRKEVVDELYEAIYHHQPLIHDAVWARATLEACLAVLQSAREGKEVSLHYQFPLRR